MLIHFTPRNVAEKCCLKLVILGADHWTFEGGGGRGCWLGGIGDLGKNILQTDFKGEKNIARKYIGEKNSCNEKWCIILEKKVLHSPEVWG